MSDPRVENLELMQKADIALADLVGAGVLPADKASAFYQRLIKEAVFMRMAKSTTISSPTYSFPKIAIGTRMLRAAGAGTALSVADRFKPVTSEVPLTVKSYKGEIRLNDDVLEDNIERGTLESTVTAMAATAISRDLEEAAIQGDTTSADLFLKQQDGLLELVATHTYNAGSAALALTHLEEGRKLLPHQYLRDRKSNYWFTSPNCELGFRADISNRATAGGDRYLFEDVPIAPLGHTMIPVPMFPETLGAGADTRVVLMDPKLFLIGMYRKITLKKGYDVSAGEMILVWTVRVAFNIIEEDATVQLLNVTIA